MENTCTVIQSDDFIDKAISIEARQNFLKFLESVKSELVNCSVVEHSNHSNHSNW